MGLFDSIGKLVNEGIAAASKGAAQQGAGQAFSPTGDDWHGLSPSDAVGFWFRHITIEQAYARGQQALEATLAGLGLRDLPHWQHVHDTFLRAHAADPAFLQGEQVMRARLGFGQAGMSAPASGGFGGAFAPQPAPAMTGGFSGGFAPAAMSSPAPAPVQGGGFGAAFAPQPAPMSAPATGGGFSGGFGAAMAGGDIPVPFERYVEMLTAVYCWTQAGRDARALITPTFGISPDQYQAFSAYWNPRISSDAGLAARAEALEPQFSARYR